jgi:predicted trehalose synthase
MTSASVTADLAALRASWQSVRGGWMVARRDARALIEHRRILVDTQAMTPDGMQVVLRTRLRLIGDTQTDVLLGWLDSVTVKDLDSTVAIHFQAVEAAIDGWSVARAMERLLARGTAVIGSLAAMAATIERILTTPPTFHAVLVNPALWTSFAFALTGSAVRCIVRWRLRVLFRRNPPAGLIRA